MVNTVGMTPMFVMVLSALPVETPVMATTEMNTANATIPGSVGMEAAAKVRLLQP